MATARSEQVDLSVTTVYHCMTRCVRRAFLCGEDHYSGKNYEHRKKWIRDRLRDLAEIFAIDVCAYAVMSNHLHVVLRVDEERAQAWPAEEVARRYVSLYVSSKWRWEAKRSAKERAKLVEDWRERLTNISWMMRALSEFIARKANREEGVRGRFWEGRFQSQPICDEQGLLACMAYVDLNPVRAGMANTLEGSDFTSIQERLHERAKQKSQHRAKAAPKRLAPMADEKSSGQAVHGLPISLDDYRRLLQVTGSILAPGKRGKLAETNTEASDGADENFAGSGNATYAREPIALGYLGYRSADVDTGRTNSTSTLTSKQAASKSAGSASKSNYSNSAITECTELLARLGISWQGWLAAMSGKELLRASAIGCAHSIDELSQRRNRKWLKGIRMARQLAA